MKHYNIGDMKLGWFVGGFEPRAYESEKCEFAIKRMGPGRWIRSYYHPRADVILCVLEGSVYYGKLLVTAGECMIFDPGENVCLYSPEESVLLYCIYGDTEYSRDKYTDWAIIADTYEVVFPFYQYKKNHIDFEDISVIVQGAVDKAITPVAIKRIRSILPGSTIILSTWEGQDVTGVDYDVLVKSKDPGGAINQIIEDFDITYTNNTNRQLISIQAGLKEVKTLYTLKIRTDMIPITNSFLGLFDMFPDSTEECRIFSHKVLISDIYTRHWFSLPMGNIPLLFHPSDWFFFGYTNDLKKYFNDIRTFSEEEIGGYKNLKNPDVKMKYKSQWNGRFVPEQFFAINALKNNGIEIEMDDWSDITKENMFQSEMFIMNNFITLDFFHHGMMLPKYEGEILGSTGDVAYGTPGLYSYNIYKRLYDYYFAKGNKRYDRVEWDCEGFYHPFSAIKQHNAQIMKRFSEERGEQISHLGMPRIDSSMISVVVQGYTDAAKAEFHAVFESLREFFPKAEIILSTWKGCNTEGFDFDKCILSEDPGGTDCGTWGDAVMLNNYNRQLISTKEGLKKATRQFVLKIRTDMVVLGDGILHCFGYSEGRKKDLCVFSERLLVGELFSRKEYKYEIDGYTYYVQTPFHPSDWFVFGAVEDVKEYYESLDIISDEEAGNYKVINKEVMLANKYPFKWRYPPEQQMCMGIVRKHFQDVSFVDWTDVTDNLIDFSKDFIFSNFMILNYAQNQFLELKHDSWIYDNSGYSYTDTGLLTNSEEMQWIKNQKQ